MLDTQMQVFKSNDVIYGINVAKEGEFICYHRGYYPIDVGTPRSERWDALAETRSVFELVYNLYRKGEVFLLQRKICEFCYEYFAIKASSSYKNSKQYLNFAAQHLPRRVS